MSKISNIVSQVKLVREKFPNKSILGTFLILLDIKYWQKKKKMLWDEYFWYEFDKKNTRERLDYVLDDELMNDIPAKCNDSRFVKFLNEKALFNEKFKKYLGRDYGLFSRKDYESFQSFLKKYKALIIKPEDGMCGRGVEKIQYGKFDLNDFLRVTEQGPIMAEEIIRQHPDINKLNPDSVNTIRIVTMKHKDGTITAPLACIRIGRAGLCVDNLCSGGMAAKVDSKTGIVTTPAYDGNVKMFKTHPDSGIKIEGMEIPLWDKIVNCVLDAASMLPECRFIGWDVAVGNDENVFLIEGNSRPGAGLFQIPAKRGLREIYNKYLGLT